MGILKDTRKQLREERRKNELLTAKLNKAEADLAYLAMMTDVELEQLEEEEYDE